jgi:hypothetical protein
MKTYGKVFPTQYTGSLYGKGVVAHAVLDYAISNADEKDEVELNPPVLANVFGDVTPEQITKTIDFLAAPDPLSRTPAEEGRRLKKLDGFRYWVVNRRKFRAEGVTPERRASNTEAVKRHRENKKNGAAGVEWANGHTNHPPLEEVLAYFQTPEAGGFTRDEIEAQFQRLQDGASNGYWMWGQRKMQDWKGNLATRLKERRAKLSSTAITVSNPNPDLSKP